MRPLIEGDILAYEVGAASEKRMVAAAGTQFEEVSIQPQDWEFAKSVFDNRVKLICDEVEADEKPLFFLTESALVNRILNKNRKRSGEPETPYVSNFRNALSTTREYKGTRTQVKPFHYKNIVNYIMCGKFDYIVAPPGLEADDALCIHQTKALKEGKATIICSRDKDLRQCQGRHYSWECGKQASVGPLTVSGLGTLTNVNEGKIDKLGKKLPLKVLGTGDKFFYFQMLTGDTADNIEGVMGRGKAFAYNLLKNALTERECYELVAEVYVKDFGDLWEQKWEEMSNLLFIVKELNEDGTIVKWKKPSLI